MRDFSNLRIAFSHTAIRVAAACFRISTTSSLFEWCLAGREVASKFETMKGRISSSRLRTLQINTNTPMASIRTFHGYNELTSVTTAISLSGRRSTIVLKVAIGTIEDVHCLALTIRSILLQLTLSSDCRVGIN